MKGRIIYTALFFLIFLLNNASGQTESETIASDTMKLHLIETTDGNQYIGEIVFEDEEAVRLKTQGLGKIKLSRVHPLLSGLFQRFPFQLWKTNSILVPVCLEVW